MTTIQLKQPTFRRSTVLSAGLILTLLLLLIGAASWWFSPIGARYRNVQQGLPVALESAEITLQADNTLNHVFSPQVAQVSAGTTVTWHFAEVDESGTPVEHNVVFENGPISPNQSEGTFTFNFDEAGVYDYVCTLHSFMNGRLIVTE